MKTLILGESRGGLECAVHQTARASPSPGDDITGARRAAHTLASPPAACLPACTGDSLLPWWSVSPRSLVSVWVWLCVTSALLNASVKSSMIYQLTLFLMNSSVTQLRAEQGTDLAVASSPCTQALVCIYLGPTECASLSWHLLSSGCWVGGPVHGPMHTFFGQVEVGLRRIISTIISEWQLKPADMNDH